MSDEYPSVKLLIKGYRVAVVDPNVTSDESLPFEPLLLESNSLELGLLDFFRRQIENDRITSKNDFIILGQLLHRALFTPEVQKTFDLARNYVNPNAEKRLRIELEFRGSDQQLAKLPWEYLCYKTGAGEWAFISTVVELVLTRFPQMGKSANLVKLDPTHINVLLVALNPSPKPPDKGGPGDLTGVINGVRAQLEQFKKNVSPHGIQVDIQPVGPPFTWESFEQLIKKPECQPHILHLIAHGNFDKDKDDYFGTIAFHRTDDPEVLIQGGNIHPIQDKRFVNLFAEANKLPRFAFLHMCKGGAIVKEGTSAGVALCLAEQGVPAVVAMQHSIDLDVSIDFSERFYNGLGLGQTIDEAVQNSRMAIANKYGNSRAFGTPVLYLSTRSDQVLPKIPKKEPPPPPDPSSYLSKIITTSMFNADLLPIMRDDYLDTGKLTRERIDPLLKLCQKTLANREASQWIDELDRTYTGLDLFTKEGRELGNLCMSLKEKVIELARRPS